MTVAEIVLGCVVFINSENESNSCGWNIAKAGLRYGGV